MGVCLFMLRGTVIVCSVANQTGIVYVFHLCIFLADSLYLLNVVLRNRICDGKENCTEVDNSPLGLYILRLHCGNVLAHYKKTEACAAHISPACWASEPSIQSCILLKCNKTLVRIHSGKQPMVPFSSGIQAL